MMSVKIAAQKLGVSAATVYALCAARKISFSRVGLGRGVIRLSDSDLEAYLAAHRVQPERPKLKHIS
jgi:excisionase family DNA binding protein